MNKLKRVYWDACTWIAYISKEEQVQNSQGTNENRFRMSSEILDSAKNRQLEIVTSAFTLAEVCKGHSASQTHLEKLPQFFEKTYILTVPVDKEIGLLAQHLQTKELNTLKPPDAVHLASALRAEVSEFHTFDDKILKLNEKISCKMGFKLLICKPTEATELPLFKLGKQNSKT